ncbi:hypothetical protein [Paenibacillus luteus]|uniref:hypothetical protein n=1 Tax=Paenibacillus luteus TaxID=2545753 RepID=UPI001141F0B1|nr:hypothetical protein [Paenibacillus luteus]
MDNKARIALIMEEYHMIDEESRAQLAAGLLRFFSYKGDVTAEALLGWADLDLEQLFNIMSGMRLTRLYVPDVIDMYAGMESGQLSSRVSFGTFAENEHFVEEPRLHRQYGSYEVPPAIHRLYELEEEFGSDMDTELGLIMQRYDRRYPSTPPDFIPFASSGVDGIHYCFVTDFGAVNHLEDAYIAIVSPMDFGSEVSLIARNLNDFLRILCTDRSLFYHSPRTLETYFQTAKERQEQWEGLSLALSKLKTVFGLTEVADLAEYMRDLHEKREQAICIHTQDTIGVISRSGSPKQPGAAEPLPQNWENRHALQAYLEDAGAEAKLAFVREAQFHKKLADRRVYGLCKRVLKELELYHELYNLSEIVE